MPFEVTMSWMKVSDYSSVPRIFGCNFINIQRCLFVLLLSIIEVALWTMLLCKSHVNKDSISLIY